MKLRQKIPCYYSILVLIFTTLAIVKFYKHRNFINQSQGHLRNFPIVPGSEAWQGQAQKSITLSYTLSPIESIFGNALNEGSQTLVKTFYNKTLQPPGIILSVKGGIGNQLFQYACSYALARDLKWPLYIFHPPTPQKSAHRGFQPLQREFSLDQFQIPLDNIIDSSTITPGGILYQNDRQFLERTFLHRKDIDTKFVSLGGNSYCQSIEYWKNYEEDIKTMFKPHEWAISVQKLGTIINKIEKSGESVAVHVRRGDFTRVTGFNVPTSYQRLAIRKIIAMLDERVKRKPVFFIFSDDIRHARKKLKDFEEKYEFVFVSEEITNSTSIEEFYLMTLCKHIVLPNSTYSWWAAYLMKNLEKIVLASAFNPTFFGTDSSKRDWFNEELFGKIYHPKEWIVIDPFTGGFVKNSSTKSLELK